MERKKKKANTKNREPFDYENFEQEAIAKLRAGKGLTGPEGALTGMIQRILQAALEGEMDEHIQEDRPNRRNGHKTGKSYICR